MTGLDDRRLARIQGASHPGEHTAADVVWLCAAVRNLRDLLQAQAAETVREARRADVNRERARVAETRTRQLVAAADRHRSQGGELHGPNDREFWDAVDRIVGRVTAQ